MELISIIIPVYNAAKYLGNCIESVLKQDYPEFELICVNDGSKDNSLEILKKYADMDERVRIIDKVNEGPSAARNDGIQAAKGEYLVFVDADDWIDPETCRVAFEKMQETGADIILWSYMRERADASLPKRIFDEEEIIFEDKELQKLHRRYIGLCGKELARPETEKALSPVWGKLYRASIIKEHRIEFMDLAEIGTYEDGFFNLHYFAHIQKAVYINKHFYHYRNGVENSVTAYRPQVFKQWEKQYEVAEKYIQDNHCSEEYETALQNRIALSSLELGIYLMKSDCSKKERKMKLREVISTEQYRKAIQQLDFQYFPIHWKLYFGAAKRKQVGLLYLLLVAIRKLR